jgi:hypothetical protein
MVLFLNLERAEEAFAEIVGFLALIIKILESWSFKVADFEDDRAVG